MTRLQRLHRAGHRQSMDDVEIPKRVFKVEKAGQPENGEKERWNKCSKLEGMVTRPR